MCFLLWVFLVCQLNYSIKYKEKENKDKHIIISITIIILYYLK
jgi:hypothetical protein